MTSKNKKDTTTRQHSTNGHSNGATPEQTAPVTEAKGTGKAKVARQSKKDPALTQVIPVQDAPPTKSRASKPPVAATQPIPSIPAPLDGTKANGADSKKKSRAASAAKGTDDSNSKAPIAPVVVS